MAKAGDRIQNGILYSILFVLKFVLDLLIEMLCNIKILYADYMLVYLFFKYYCIYDICHVFYII